MPTSKFRLSTLARLNLNTDDRKAGTEGRDRMTYPLTTIMVVIWLRNEKHNSKRYSATDTRRP